MDNRIFNVNGDHHDDLLAVLKVAFRQGSFGHTKTVKGWRIDKQYGFILYSYVYDSDKDVIKFPFPLTVDSVYPIIKQYLESEDTWNDAIFDKWDADLQHDGHNGRGWRVYCEDWGKVAGHQSAFIAIRPAYAWYGK